MRWWRMSNDYTKQAEKIQYLRVVALVRLSRSRSASVLIRKKSGMSLRKFVKNFVL